MVTFECIEGNSYSNEPKRPPKTGHLSIQVHSIKDIDHAAYEEEEEAAERFKVSIESDFGWTNRMMCPVSHAGQKTEREAFFKFKVDTRETIQFFLLKRDKNTGNPVTICVLFLRVLDIDTYSTRKGSTSSGGALNAWFPLAPAGKVHLTISFGKFFFKPTRMI